MLLQSQYEAVPDSQLGAVAPGAAFGRAARGGRAVSRASALVMVCAMAACVALLGSLGDAEEPISQAFLAVKNEIDSKPVTHLKAGKSMALAAKANSLASTASGIMNEAKHSKLALVTGKTHVAAAKANVAAAKVLLKGVPAASKKVGKQALDEEAPAEDEAAEVPAEDAGDAEDAAPAEDAGDAPADDAASEDDTGGEPKKKILGASGEEVFGKKDGAVAGFLGFQDKGEPNVLGIPLPIVMFLFVICVTATCLTVGCMIARKTDILKVNKEEAGAAAKPVDEDVEDARGYDWRNKN